MFTYLFLARPSQVQLRLDGLNLSISKVVKNAFVQRIVIPIQLFLTFVDISCVIYNLGFMLLNHLSKVRVVSLINWCLVIYIVVHFLVFNSIELALSWFLLKRSRVLYITCFH